MLSLLKHVSKIRIDLTLSEMYAQLEEGGPFFVFQQFFVLNAGQSVVKQVDA